MDVECPVCGTELAITVDGDVPDYPIRIEWFPQVPDGCVGVAVAESHQQVEIWYTPDMVDGCDFTVIVDGGECRDRYDAIIGAVHTCKHGGDAGDRARVSHPAPTRPTSN